MCETYFPELDSTIVASEELAMRLYVRDNLDIFMQPNDPTDASKGRIHALSSLTGPLGNK